MSNENNINEPDKNIEPQACNSCMTYCQTSCETMCQTGCEVSCQSTCQKSCQNCQGRCESTCQKICQTSCEKLCQSTCEINCQSTCQKSCQNCEGRCETTCENSCQSSCQKNCQENCERLCQSTCETSCMGTCERSCQNCEGRCESSCQRICQDNCERLCQDNCEINCLSTCQVSCQNCEGRCETTCQKSCQNCEGRCETVCEKSCQNCEGNVCLSSCQNCLGDVCLSSCQKCEGRCETVCEKSCQNCLGLCQDYCEINCLGECQVACQCTGQNNQGSPTQPIIDNSLVYRIRLANTSDIYLNINIDEDCEINNNCTVNINTLNKTVGTKYKNDIYRVKWEFKSINYNNKDCYLINSNLINFYSLRNNSSNCVITDIKNNYSNAAAIELISESNSNSYKILLSGTDLYLTAMGTIANSSVKWSNLGTGNQIWEIETIVSSDPLFIEPKFPFTEIISSYTPPVRTEREVNGKIEVTVEIPGVFESFNQKKTTITDYDSRLKWACAGFAYANLCSFYSREEIKPWWFVYYDDYPGIWWVHSLNRVIRILSSSFVNEITYTTQEEYYAAIKSYIDKGQPVIVHCTGETNPAINTHYAVAYKYQNDCKDEDAVFIKDSIMPGPANLTSLYGIGTESLRGVMDRGTHQEDWKIVGLVILNPIND